jgi:hypothetical protein
VAAARQNTGWADFDTLIADATRRDTLTPADIAELRTRANDIFGSVRASTDMPNKTMKLNALRDFKATLDDALDATLDTTKLDPTGPRSFKDLSRQEGMASTLRATQHSAGEGAFSPMAVKEQMRSVFGDKATTLEPFNVQQVAGALERSAKDSFAANPEQYKALIAGTLLGSGALVGAASGMKMDDPSTWIAPAAATTLAPILLGTKGGRKFLTAGGAKRGAAGRTAQELFASILTGQADVPALFE